MRWLGLVVFIVGCSGGAPIGPNDGGGGDATSEGGVCAAPKVMCGSSCVDVASDAMNCGVCGFACGTGSTCCAGACSTDCATAITGLGPSRGPMSGGSWVTISGKGFSPGARVFLGASRAPARTVDANTVLALAPPGLAGDVDVRVESGTAKTSKARAFRYVSYGFQGPWKKVNMSSARGNWPGISVMQDGRALITGGVANSMGNSVLDTADVYDPATSQSAATPGKMSAPRWTEAHVTLLDGKTLVLGTWFGGYSPANGPFADLFESGTFKPTKGKPTLEHRWPHAVLLADGRAMIVSYTTAAPDLYDPATETFAPMSSAPDTTGYRPVRLLDGRVLLIKGARAPLRLYDPDTSAWTTAGLGPTAIDGDAYTLPDGRVLYIAGTLVGATETSPTAVLEIFDPKAPDFSPLPYKLAEARQKTLTTAMLGDGTVLVIGGEVGKNVLVPACSVNSFVLTDGVERIDPAAKTVSAFDKLPEKNFVMSGATLHDGSVVAAGGAPCGGGNAYPYFYFLQGLPPPN